MRGVKIEDEAYDALRYAFTAAMDIKGGGGERGGHDLFASPVIAAFTALWTELGCSMRRKRLH